ncbi:MAG: homocysteine S-methyltransferase family protein [Eubacterium sp.]|nr:homocysteine S-methyltransferase family protein [Eubacterium sp.]
MTKQEFRNLFDQGVVLLDGATGTNLQQAGMPGNVCPEQWILEHPDVMRSLQRSYVEAGTQILYAPTFTANRIKLAEYGLAGQLVSMNTSLVRLAKEAAQGRAFVAGDLTMTGQQLYPLGELQFEDLVEVYKEQAKVLYDAGVDLFVVETMMSLQETRAAVIAIQETCSLPVMASLTFEDDGRTLFGTNPETAVVVLQSLGADAVGLNCSTGPMEMVEIVEQMYAYANIPILAKPNAGLPELENGRTVYKTTPQEFAQAGKKLIEAGAAALGGCCGTTPAHIRALADAAKGCGRLPIRTEARRVLASERKVVEIALDGGFQVVGERINPTGKKKLQEQLRAGSLELVRAMAREQEENGACVLDINMGMNGIDEKQMMLEAVYEVTTTVDCPLCIDSSYIEVIEAALRVYPGRALINSISLEKEKFERLLPIAKKYGAMFILLPLSDAGLPETLEDKHAIVHTILDEALRQGFAKEDIIVDGLVATVGANPKAALECLDTISYCSKKLGLATICGLSNISFGLPERSFVNTAFLTMAIARGLTMAIANPSQDLLMNTAAAADMLLHKDGSDLFYINRMQAYKQKQEKLEQEKQRQLANEKTASTSWAGTLAAGAGAEGTGKSGALPASAAGQDLSVQSAPVYRAVLQGEKKSIVAYAQEELARGTKPEQVIDQYLIPAINEVGELFNAQKYFLPQLIASANAMKAAIEYLEPKIERNGREEESATLVVATVEGDIHDIGKNLVVLMLRNYGYHVIDLGKDVAAETIVTAAIEEDAAIIGLSALMTTTMMRMQEVVQLAKERNFAGKVIIGGAAITPGFAEEIGADGYSKDAADCVKLVERLLR